MRVLLVEDNPQKIARIQKILADYNLDLTICSAALNAKKELTKGLVYDLLVLDLNLPSRVGDSPKEGEGIDLLEEVLAVDTYAMPNKIVALSQYSKERQLFDDRFGTHDVTSIDYRVNESAWETKLKGIVERIYRFLNQKTEKQYDCDIGIVVALSKELKPYFELLGNVRPIQDIDDPTIFYEGELITPQGALKVVLGQNSEMGCTSTSITTTKLIIKFKPRFIAMTGICGGLKDQVEIGDIVISDICFDYYFGKKTGPSFDEFSPDPRQCKLPRKMYKELTYFLGTKNVSEGLSTGKITSPSIEMHVTASGSSVVTDPTFLEHIRSTAQRKLSAIEMEIYGFYSSCENSHSINLDYIALKTVCDLADSQKNDDYQDDCCALSAKLLVRFVEFLDSKEYFSSK